MKVLFLDIDGVLNSRVYEIGKKLEDSFIDISRLPLVSKIVSETGAFIVLSSTWREHWKENISECDDMGVELHNAFDKYNLKIYDTTGADKKNRSQEIREWLQEHDNDVENYVILDDTLWGWLELSDHVVRTDYLKGKGLEEEHVYKAINILKQ